MQLGMIGLGRMGANIVRRLMRDGHDCVVYDVGPGRGRATRGRRRDRHRLARGVRREARSPARRARNRHGIRVETLRRRSECNPTEQISADHSG